MLVLCIWSFIKENILYKFLYIFIELKYSYNCVILKIFYKLKFYLENFDFSLVNIMLELVLINCSYVYFFCYFIFKSLY